MSRASRLANQREEQKDEIRSNPFRQTSIPLNQLLSRKSEKWLASKGKHSKSMKTSENP